MATNPIRRYHLSKLPERQPRSDTFPESHHMSAAHQANFHLYDNPDNSFFLRLAEVVLLQMGHLE
jgi:hypothetical protein